MMSRLLAMLVFAAWCAQALGAPSLRTLPEAGDEIALAQGEGHRYAFVAAEGGTHVLVEQIGIDVVLAVESAGDTLLRVNATGGPRGREDLVVDVPAGTALVLDVRPKLRLIPAGHYRLRITPLSAGDAPVAVLRELSAAGASELAESADGQRAVREHLQRALSALPASGESNKALRALIRFRSAAISRRLNDFEQAIVDYRLALSTNLAMQDAHSEARTRNGLGLALRWTDRIADARYEFEQALRVADRVGDKYEAASAENNVCLTYLHFGDMARARPCLERTVARYERDQLGEHASVALVNLAAAYDYLGLPDLAGARFEQALALRRGGVEQLPIAQTLLNLAGLRRNVGDFSHALAAIDEALKILQALDDRAYLARALRVKGSIFQSAGLPERAALYFDQALPMAQALGDHRGEADLRAALAEIATDPVEAERQHRAATAIYERAADVQSAAREHIALSAIARELNRTADARGESALGCALAARGGVRAVQFACEIERAQVALAIDAMDDAKRATTRAGRLLTRASLTSDRLALARVRVAVAARAGTAAQALALAERELAREDSVAASTLSPELRERERTLRAALLGDWIDLLETSRDARTPARDLAILTIVERERMRELGAWIAYGRAGRDGASEARARELLHRRATLDTALREGKDAERIASLQRQVEETTAAIDRESRAASTASATAPPDITRLRAQLRAGDVMTVHALGHRAMLRAWLSRERLSIVLAPNAREVKRHALALGESARVAGGSSGVSAKALSALLFADERFTPGARWYAVLDAGLQQIPLALLRDPIDDAPLLQRVAPVNVPVLGWFAPDRTTVPWDELRIAVFADPLVPGTTAPPAGAVVLRGDVSLPRLVASADEADMIGDIAGRATVQTWLRERATRGAVLSAARADFDIVHVATHASADVGRLDASALLLSPDAGGDASSPSALVVGDVLAAATHQRLVVLSGCATSVGRRSAVVGAFGLTEAFLASGTREVVGALWPVDDRATATLMRAFYAAFARSGDAPDALRRAQLAAAGDTAATRTPDWAAFRLTAGASVVAVVR
jgi:CHAT domain-containing protein/tetratricopeptide (TPR) repeat protein